ncbi:DUF547 domain-containing protein [soil metagenome]
MMNILFLLLLVTGAAGAQNTSGFFEKSDSFFKQYVDNGKVRYAEIKKNPKYLNDLLAEAKKAKVSPVNKEEYKAFWINAYNIATIKGIVDAYPVKSPLDIKGFFDVKKFSLGQRSVTLDQIEKEILLGKFPEEERFHFVLVCAARSCPPIINEAYYPGKLEQQLERQTRSALNDPGFIKVSREKVLFSELMKWYNKDFTGKGKTLVEYVNQYREKKIPSNYEQGYYKYNWELNDI